MSSRAEGIRRKKTNYWVGKKELNKAEMDRSQKAKKKLKGEDAKNQ